MNLENGTAYEHEVNSIILHVYMNFKEAYFTLDITNQITTKCFSPLLE